MMKAVKIAIGSTLLGAMLAVASAAQPVNFVVDAAALAQRGKDKEKEKEKPVERDKRDDKKDEKKDDKPKKKPD